MKYFKTKKTTNRKLAVKAFDKYLKNVKGKVDTGKITFVKHQRGTTLAKIPGKALGVAKRDLP